MNVIRISDLTGRFYNAEMSPAELAVNAYAKNPYVQMVINRIASTCAYLKLENDTPAWNVQTKLNIYTNLLLFGGVYILPIKAIGVSKVTELQILNFVDVIVQYEEGNIFKPVRSYSYFGNVYKPEDIIFIKFPNSTSQYQRPLSPLNSAQSIYTASNSINEFEQYLYQNRGVVGLLSGVGDMPLISSDRDDLQKQFDSDTTGVINAGKIKMVQNDVKYTALTFKPSEMLSTESQLHKLRTICSLYNVDSSLFNDPANQTYNNVQEGVKAYYNQAVLPLCDYVLLNLNNYFEITDEESQIKVDYADIDALKKDDKLYAEAKKILCESKRIFLENLKMEIEMGLITLDEAKQKMTIYEEEYS